MRFPDERDGKLVVVAHCILNQNSRTLGLAHYPAVVKEIHDILRRHNVGFLQMPCPELIYGVGRPTKTKEEYDSPGYRAHSRQIALSIVNQLEEYFKNGIKPVAVLGIKNSPSCNISDSMDETGILMEELMSELKKRKLEIPIRAINTSETDTSDVKWLENILETV
ncbi:MAG: CD3072 family TudS-related putative desulfidase [Candidatus Bathyarchaeia archaeon]